MAIILSTTQQEIQISSTPALQYWEVTPFVQDRYYYQGGTTPSVFTQHVAFRDVLGTDAAIGYTSFKYRTVIEAQGQFPDVLLFSGPLATNGTFVNYANGLSGNHSFTYQNLHLLQPGLYTFKINHEIWAKNNFNTDVIIDNRYLTLTLRVLSATAPLISPMALDYTWILGQSGPVLSTNVNISGNNWGVDSPRAFFWTPASGATVTSPTSWNGSNISGSGNITTQLAMFAGAVPNPITENPLHLSLRVNAGLFEIPVTVYFLQQNGLFLEKNALEFEAIKGISEARAQTVIIRFTETFTLELPPWLTLINNGSTHLFQPISSYNMETGTYTGTVKIKNTSGTVLGTININYIISNAVSLPYDGNYAFTLDNVFTQFYSAYPDAYFDVTLRARVFPFNSTEYIEKAPLQFKLPLFRGSQKMNIGAVIHRLMERMGTLGTHFETPYLPAQVWVDVNEQRGSETRTYNLGPINFVAGLTPMLRSGCGFLDINPGARRALSSSTLYLNIIISGYASGIVYKNGEQISEQLLPEGINAVKLDFDSMGAVEGDLFEYLIIHNESGDQISKKIIIFPEGYSNLTIIWEDEYLLRQTMSFTGKYKLKNTFEQSTQELDRDGVPFLDKIRTAKTGKFTLNTGWILKSDKASVESLCRSRNALLILPEGSIRIVPIPGEMTIIDIDESTIAIDIDFQINREYDEEIHLF